MTSKILAAIILGGVLFSTTACNTVKGLGRDIESVGQAGSNAIN